MAIFKAQVSNQTLFSFKSMWRTDVPQLQLIAEPMEEHGVRKRRSVQRLPCPRKLGFCPYEKWVSLDCHRNCGLPSIALMNCVLHTRMPFRLIWPYYKVCWVDDFAPYLISLSCSVNRPFGLFLPAHRPFGLLLPALGATVPTTHS